MLINILLQGCLSLTFHYAITCRAVTLTNARFQTVLLLPNVNITLHLLQK